MRSALLATDPVQHECAFWHLCKCGSFCLFPSCAFTNEVLFLVSAVVTVASGFSHSVESDTKNSLHEIRVAVKHGTFTGLCLTRTVAHDSSRTRAPYCV